jgi:hypothetical protein
LRNERLVSDTLKVAVGSDGSSLELHAEAIKLSSAKNKNEILLVIIVRLKKRGMLSSLLAAVAFPAR